MSKFVYTLNELFKNEKLSTVSGQKALGISKTQLGRYLSGFYMPSLNNCLKICDYFNCSIDYLLGIDKEKNRFGQLGQPDFDKFANRFQEVINKHGITIYQTANELGFNRNDWTYWNKKKTLPTLELVERLATRFNVSAEYLIGRTEII